MMSSKMLKIVPRVASLQCSRNIGIVAPLFSTATDPIQKLFLEKLQEYKKKSSGGKIVDSTPEIEREMKTELERVAKQFGGGSGVDMTQFPAFKFTEPQVDIVNN